MKKYILLLILVSTTIFANPFCIKKDFVNLSRITSNLRNSKSKVVDVVLVKRGLQQISHIHAKHNADLSSGQRAIFAKAEKFLKSIKI